MPRRPIIVGENGLPVSPRRKEPQRRPTPNNRAKRRVLVVAGGFLAVAAVVSFVCLKHGEWKDRLLGEDIVPTQGFSEDGVGGVVIPDDAPSSVGQLTDGIVIPDDAAMDIPGMSDDAVQPIDTIEPVLTGFETGLQAEAAKEGIRFIDGGVDTFMTSERQRLTEEYSSRYYGEAEWQLTDPEMIILHSTGGTDLQALLKYFKPDAFQDSSRKSITPGPNVSAHFVIERDGTIRQMAPLGARVRCAIGLNHTSINIENLSDDKGNNLTEAQVKANAWLVSRLVDMFGSVDYVIPHKVYSDTEAPFASLVTDVSGTGYTPYKQNGDGDLVHGKRDPYGNDYQRIMGAFDADGYREDTERASAVWFAAY